MPDRTIPGVLDPQERRAVEEQFGVGARQVVRDHVISHGLAAITAAAQGDVVFFGGTALSRTLLPDLRLSEDIDLIALGNRRDVGARIQAEVQRRFRRTLGAVTFIPPLGEAPHPQPSILEVKGTRIQVQLLTSEGYPPWPRQLVDLEQRYSDAPPARLQVLTPPAFVASKLTARGALLPLRPTPDPLESLIRRTAKRAGLGGVARTPVRHHDDADARSEGREGSDHSALVMTTV